MAEELSEEDLERLHDDLHKRAEETRAHLAKRQSSKKKEKVA
jgi:hypothetical protein